MLTANLLLFQVKENLSKRVVGSMELHVEFVEVMLAATTTRQPEVQLFPNDLSEKETGQGPDEPPPTGLKNPTRQGKILGL